MQIPKNFIRTGHKTWTEFATTGYQVTGYPISMLVYEPDIGDMMITSGGVGCNTEFSPTLFF